ncbi:T-cell surface glycoprotein CD1c2 [Camelus dromedarius]|uniref:T-cell surface glycoprotein CD1c2 n=1 Tax=Camelus dromedarius TaxID=9838 RepID=A0A5N4CNY2_CAMDR|nr:T-cell surface glycoprotein CD1c2 [Camelus dromedarius]
MLFLHLVLLAALSGGGSADVKPEAWLSSSPILGSDQLVLACHVSGYYPKPIWVMWMRGEQEQSDTQQGDILPSVDGTWYVRAILHVAAEEAAGLSCRVRHSSLGDQDIVLYWGESDWIYKGAKAPPEPGR